jgi:hypothetical protein
MINALGCFVFGTEMENRIEVAKTIMMMMVMWSMIDDGRSIRRY